MKTGILGGTFDPIHRAHLAIARQALEEYGLDEIWFMPAGDPYFKEGSPVTSPKLRYEMTERCIEEYGESRFLVSDFEISDKDRTYTARTLARLKARYPARRFYFILGLDSLEAMHSWYEPGQILQNAVILCALRNQERSGNETRAHDEGGTYKQDDEKRFQSAVRDLCECFPYADIRRLHSKEIILSSTKVRELFAAGKDIGPLVTPAVERFIKEHGLYRADS